LSPTVASPRALREAQDAGWLSCDNDRWHIRISILENLPDAAPDLIASWDAHRRTRYQEQLDFVPVRRLSRENRLYLLRHPEEVEWLAVYDQVIDYSQYKPQPDEVVSVPNLTELRRAMKEGAERKRNESRRGFPHYEPCVTTPALRQHARDARERETEDLAYEKNFVWGMVRLGVLDEADQDVLSGGDEQWDETSVRRRIDHLADSIARYARRLEVLKTVRERVNALGG
jgi:hypothetical protein